jgi:CHAT domain-containing protein/tetratricopeptide (TPR) repeat protein
MKLMKIVRCLCLFSFLLCAAVGVATRGQDDKRAAAERLSSEAEQLAKQGTKEALEQAVSKYLTAIPLYKAAGDKVGEADALNNLGSLYSYLGEGQQALARFAQALPLYKAIGDRGGEAAALNNMGSVSLDMGEPQQALDYFGQALPLLRVTKNASGEATTLNNMGGLYFSLGEPQKALDYLGQSLLLRRATGDRGGEAVTLTNMGDINFSLGQNRKALEYYNQALPLYRAAGDRRSEAVALNQIGQVYAESGDLQQAVEYYGRALPLSRAAGDRSGEALTLGNVGAAFLALGEQQEALETYQQVLQLYQAIGDRSAEARTLFNIAFNERGTGKPSAAIRHIEAAIDILESVRSNITSQSLRTSYFASVQDYYEFYIELLMQQHKQQPTAGYDARALQASERARARSLLETLAEAGADIRQGVEPALLERERALQQQLNSLAQAQVKLLSGPHDKDAAAALARDLDAATNEFQQVEAEIRQTSPRYAALTQPRPLSLAEVQQTLDQNTLLLEYALGKERSYLWVVAADSIKSYELPKRAEIEEAARQFYASLTTTRQWSAAGGEELRGVLSAANPQAGAARGAGPAAAAHLARIVLAPAVDQLGGKRLLVVADGALQFIPFAALSLPAAEGAGATTYRPLVTEHEIVSLPSASTLSLLRREAQARPPARKALAVLADPVFTPDDARLANAKPTAARPNRSAPSRRTQRGLALGNKPAADSMVARLSAQIPRLPGTRREAEQILALVPAEAQMHVFDFAASRPAALDPKLGDYRFVHFATHGLLDSQRPELSGLMLSQFDAQGTPQDGFLRAHEVFNLKFNADVVVLSACQTGLGKEIRGEGLVGLTRGFMYAGAPRVVVSLWSVNDAATAELMTRFYRGMLVDKLRPAQALQQAQVALLQDKRYSAPFYWAAFTLQGEWR